MGFQLKIHCTLDLGDDCSTQLKVSLYKGPSWCDPLYIDSASEFDIDVSRLGYTVVGVKVDELVAFVAQTQPRKFSSLTVFA